MCLGFCFPTQWESDRSEWSQSQPIPHPSSPCHASPRSKHQAVFEVNTWCVVESIWWFMTYECCSPDHNGHFPWKTHHLDQVDFWSPCDWQWPDGLIQQRQKRDLQVKIARYEKYRNDNLPLTFVEKFKPWCWTFLSLFFDSCSTNTTSDYDAC